MPKRNILLLDQEHSPWPSFLEEFFNDTLSQIHVFHNFSDAGRYVSKHPVDLAFVKDSLLAEPLIQKLKACRQSSESFRIFELGTGKPPAQFKSYDFTFNEPVIFSEFQKDLVRHLKFPDQLKVLIADDEPEILKTFVDFLKERRQPAFEISGAANGRSALESLQQSRPDVLIMDIKMPEMNGIDLYRAIRARGMDFPVIVYFDAVLGDEVIELHQIGNPAIVEKGSAESSAPDLTALILKMAYFA